MINNGIEVAMKTDKIITHIWNNGEPNKPILAALRNSNRIDDKKAVVIWPILFRYLDKSDLGFDSNISYVERAVFSTLHFYALYQRGDDNFVYKKDSRENFYNLFSQLSNLRADEIFGNGLDRRVQSILESTSIDGTINELNHLISILKGKTNGVRIDFAQLSSDLYYYQLNSDSARRVALKWGRQYYQVTSK